LPLGIFIKPSQEKVVCDGQRAICMCHAFVPKASASAVEPGINLKAGTSSNKENPSGGNYFVSTSRYFEFIFNVSFSKSILPL